MTWISISGIVLIGLGMFAAGIASGPWLKRAWWSLQDRLRSLPPLQEHHGHHRADTVPSALLTREQVTGHADAMFAASEPCLPPVPAGENPYPPYVSPERWQSYVNAGRAVEPVKADGHAPWTGEMPALTPEAEAAELDRQRYIKSHFAEPAAMTDAEMREAMRDAITSLRQPVYGEAPQDAVDEAQRVTEGLIA